MKTVQGGRLAVGGWGERRLLPSRRRASHAAQEE